MNELKFTVASSSGLREGLAVSLCWNEGNTVGVLFAGVTVVKMITDAVPAIVLRGLVGEGAQGGQFRAAAPDLPVFFKRVDGRCCRCHFAVREGRQSRDWEARDIGRAIGRRARRGAFFTNRKKCRKNLPLPRLCKNLLNSRS